MRPSARYAVACPPSTETLRLMMRLIADLVITTSLSAAYSPTATPPRISRAESSMRSSMAMRPARAASTAGTISSSVVAVRKPRSPRLTPRIGTPRSARGPPSPSPAPPAARGNRATGSGGRGPRRRRRRRAWRRDRRVSRKRLHGAIDDPLEVGRRPAVHREVQEEFAVTLRAAQWRGRHAEHVPAAKHGVAREALHDGAVLRGIAHDPTLADVLAAGLELWLDERDDLAARRQHVEDRRQHLFQRDEGHVDDGQRRLIAEEAWVQRARVCVLHDHHARVLAQPLVELAAADVDGVDDARTALEQAVREAARGGADVHADAALHADAEMLERVDELFAATADVGGAPFQVQLRLRGHERSGLVRTLTVDEHVAGHDGPQGLLPALDQPFLHQQPVQPHPRRHAFDYRGALLRYRGALLRRYERALLRGRRRNRSTTPVRNPP